ncbi:hypothetical protein MTO96_008318 [Rhipicephalus appendiculatus]
MCRRRRHEKRERERKGVERVMKVEGDSRAPAGRGVREGGPSAAAGHPNWQSCREGRGCRCGLRSQHSESCIFDDGTQAAASRPGQELLQRAPHALSARCEARARPEFDRCPASGRARAPAAPTTILLSPLAPPEKAVAAAPCGKIAPGGQHPRRMRHPGLAERAAILAGGGAGVQNEHGPGKAACPWRAAASCVSTSGSLSVARLFDDAKPGPASLLRARRRKLDSPWRPSLPLRARPATLEAGKHGSRRLAALCLARRRRPISSFPIWGEEFPA